VTLKPGAKVNEGPLKWSHSIGHILHHVSIY